MSKKPSNFLYKVIEAGYQLSPEAYNFLLGIPNEIAESLIEKALTKANSEIVANFLIDQKFLMDLVETPKTTFTPYKDFKIPAKKSEMSIKIHDEEQPQPASDLEGFVNYFRSRFDRLEGILKRRVDLRDAISISSTLKQPLKTKLKTIGIVTEKRMKGPRLFIEIEDRDSSISVMAMDDGVIRYAAELSPIHRFYESWRNALAKAGGRR